MAEPLSLSTTAVATAMQCMARYNYRNNLHLVTKPSGTSVALRRGIWIHSCLEAIHHGKGYGRLLTDLAQWALDNDVPAETVEDVQTQVTHIMAGYTRYWDDQPAWETLKPVASEVPLDLLLPNGDHLTCTVDTIVEWKGRLFIMEHKSTQRFPSADWRAIDPQTAQQYAVCKLTRAFDVDGIIFNYLSTTEPPVPHPLKNGSGFYAREIHTTAVAFERGAEDLAKVWSGTPDEFVAYCTAQRARMVQDGLFYQRAVVYKPDALVLTILRDVRFYFDLIRQAQATGIWPHSINLIRCDWCPYSTGGLCPLEMMRGAPSEMTRREFFMIETPESRREGRPLYDDAS